MGYRHSQGGAPSGSRSVALQFGQECRLYCGTLLHEPPAIVRLLNKGIEVCLFGVRYVAKDTQEPALQRWEKRANEQPATYRPSRKP